MQPPNDLESSYLPPEEANMLSTIQRGKDLALSGRLRLAEAEFRKALKLAPRLSTLHNDLGFVLLGLDRFSEAEDSFRRALELDLSNMTARDHLARTLYRQQRYLEAREEYEQIIAWHHVLELDRFSGGTRRGLGA